MNLRDALNSPRSLAGILATVCYLAATNAEPDESDKGTAPAAGSMLGKQPGAVHEDNSLKMKLIWCPPGEFKMGSPKSELHRPKSESTRDRRDSDLINRRKSNTEEQLGVTVTNGFWLGKYEVTQAEWKQIMATEPWKAEERVVEGDNIPATYVDWNDAMEFCRKLTEREHNAGRLAAGWEFTLPTEAQWERACRAETETRFYFGENESKLAEYEWFVNNTETANERHAHPVGQKRPNPWGLCDMHGNVAEWCQDFYLEKRPGGPNPNVTRKDSCRVCRGGKWISSSWHCRSASRHGEDPSERNDCLGLRVALCLAGNN